VFRLLALFGAILTGAEALPVVPLQFTPDQIALSLRTTKPPMPPADCHALNAFECSLENPTPVRDISIRWVQLDDDSELEAIIIAKMESEWDYFAFVFDWKRTWNLVGNIMCERHCYASDINFVRAHKLTQNAPIFLIARRDLGGSGSSLDTRTFFLLRDGRLRKAFEVMDRWVGLPPPEHTEKIELRQSGPWLIHHTIHEEPPESPARHACKVLTWSPQQLTYIEAPTQRPNFCNPKTGRPYTDKSWPITPY
jgi:hypothetical protein